MTTLGHQVYLQDRPSVRGGTPADEVAHIAAGRATPATLVTTRIPTNDSKPGKSVDVSRASKTGVLYIDFDIITPQGVFNRLHEHRCHRTTPNTLVVK